MVKPRIAALVVLVPVIFFILWQSGVSGTAHLDRKTETVKHLFEQNGHEAAEVPRPQTADPDSVRIYIGIVLSAQQEGADIDHGMVEFWKSDALERDVQTLQCHRKRRGGYSICSWVASQGRLGTTPLFEMGTRQIRGFTNIKHQREYE
jgi:hypothetical protein